jgi:uncharacterized iron-regulated membrane protein
VTARRAALLAHRWAGLLPGLLLDRIGATGRILSYQRAIDAARKPALFRPSGPPDPALTCAAIQRLAEAAGRPVGRAKRWPVSARLASRVRLELSLRDIGFFHGKAF